MFVSGEEGVPEGCVLGDEALYLMGGKVRGTLKNCLSYSR